MHTRTLARLLAVVLFAATFPRAAHASALKKRLHALESENAALEAKIAAKTPPADQAFRSATAAENAAKIQSPSAAGAGPFFRGAGLFSMSSATLPAAWPPVNVVYAVLHARHADFSLVPSSFGPPTGIAGRTVRPVTATVVRRNK